MSDCWVAVLSASGDRLGPCGAGEAERDPGNILGGHTVWRDSGWKSPGHGFRFDWMSWTEYFPPAEEAATTSPLWRNSRTLQLRGHNFHGACRACQSTTAMGSEQATVGLSSDSGKHFLETYPSWGVKSVKCSNLFTCCPDGIRAVLYGICLEHCIHHMGRNRLWFC